MSLLVLAVLVVTLLIVFSQIPPAELLRPGQYETTVDVEGVDTVFGAILVAIGVIALAGTAERRPSPTPLLTGRESPSSCLGPSSSGLSARVVDAAAGAGGT